MSEYKHILIDIETTDTRHTAGILSIGAVAFNAKGLHKARFYLPVDIQSCRYVGLSESKATMDFWESQGEKARAVFTDPNRVDLNVALKQLEVYTKKTCGGTKIVHMMGNSARFDLGILDNAYYACNMKPFWNPFKELCYRTFKNMGTVDGKPVPKIVRHNGGQSATHNSLQDAIEQAEHAIKLNEYYGGIIL